ncbi:MAG: helix-turn-helix domain-containing protein [Geminicoccaceae bacterium]
MVAITSLRGDALSIGELSRLTGVNIETIRYYERIGVMPAPPRTGGGRRAYGEGHSRTLSFIRRARELGFTLDDIRGLLGLGHRRLATCAEVRSIAGGHLETVRSKLADLARLEGILAAAVAQCSGESVPDCPVLEMLDRDSLADAEAPARLGG